MWDNILAIMILNVGFIIFVIAGLAVEYAILYVLKYFIQEINPLIGLVLGHFIYLPVVCLLAVYAGAVSCVTKDIADYKKASLKSFLHYVKQTYKSSLIFGMLNFILLFFLLAAGIYYLDAMDNLINPIIFFFLAWLFLFWLSASQYFFALQSMFDKKVKKNIKKMMLLLLDNTGFTLFTLLLGAIIILGVSVITFFLLFGFSTVLLWYNVALKLRMHKYEYLEKNPDANRRKIPWKTLLIEEQELVGKRSIKGMIFPDRE
jgi:uncharacterized membrane protein YesL